MKRGTLIHDCCVSVSVCAFLRHLRKTGAQHTHTQQSTETTTWTYLRSASCPIYACVRTALARTHTRRPHAAFFFLKKKKNCAFKSHWPLHLCQIGQICGRFFFDASEVLVWHLAASALVTWTSFYACGGAEGCIGLEDKEAEWSIRIFDVMYFDFSTPFF